MERLAALLLIVHSLNDVVSLGKPRLMPVIPGQPISMKERSFLSRYLSLLPRFDRIRASAYRAGCIDLGGHWLMASFVVILD